MTGKFKGIFNDFSCFSYYYVFSYIILCTWWIFTFNSKSLKSWKLHFNLKKRILYRIRTCIWISQKFRNMKRIKSEWTKQSSSIHGKAYIHTFKHTGWLNSQRTRHILLISTKKKLVFKLKTKMRYNLVTAITHSSMPFLLL